MGRMKAKLTKLENGEYDLLVDTNVKNLAGTKLSLTNCQAIERGYDLDELATAYFMQEWAWIKSSTEPYSNETVDQVKKDFVSGFQKALELMGDKNFSEDDVISMIEKSRETGLTAEYLILTKQQTEWDVEIEMETIASGSITVVDHSKNPFEVVSETSLPSKEKRTKLDADGCLILKRV